MKIKNIIAAACLISLGAVSCNKLSDFGDTNTNPNSLSKPDYSALLTNVMSGIGENYAFSYSGGLYAQYFSETQYTETSRYITPQRSFTRYYSGNLLDLQNIIENGKNINMANISAILQQYIFLNVTNLWGDVPYAESLAGFKNLLPKYDTQETIYVEVFKKLGAVVDSFDESTIEGDIIYSGDIADWKRTANSIKLLAAIQLSKKVPDPNGFAAQAFREALAASGGVFTENSQNFVVNYPGGNYQSPYFRTYLTRSDYAVSATMTDLLKSLKDNRQKVYGGASNAAGPNAKASSTVGVPYGLPRNATISFIGANNNWARILRGDKRAENSPVYIITASQIAFARAEAADLGWTTESTKEFYEQGIKLSFEQWDVEYDPNSYLEQPNVKLSGKGQNLKQIATQRYIASFPNGTEGWNIWRKTGFPLLKPAPAPLSASGQIPRRYVYTPGELLSNTVNANAAVALIPGGNSQDSRVWWDQP